MTTVIPFLPSNLKAPSFIVTLDGDDYNCIVTWNVSAQRYYINLYDEQGNWIITTPLISTPPARNIANAVYDPFLNVVVVQFVDPSQWPVPLGAGIAAPGTIIEYALEGFQPDTYNGTFRCLHLDSITFTLPMSQDPGGVVVIGKVSRLMDMVATLFNSSLIYRNSAFEVTP